MSRLVKGADLINQFGRNLPTPVIETLRLQNLSDDDQIYVDVDEYASAGVLPPALATVAEDLMGITRIDVDISVLMNTWDGFKAEELSRELFQTLTSNDTTDNESLYINIYVSKSTGTTSELKSSRLNLKKILAPADDRLKDYLTNESRYSAENYQLFTHLRALNGTGRYIISVPLSDFYDTVELTAIFDEENNPILKMSQISVTTYIKDLPSVENLTYFATISVGNPITIGSSIDGPAARLGATAYALNFSDVSYEDVMRDGAIAVYGEPAYIDEEGLYYSSVPLRALNSKYYKTEDYSREDIFAAINSLLDEYSQYLSADIDLKDAVDGITYVLTAYGAGSDFINRLNRTGQLFAVTQNVTRTSRLYQRYRILVNNIDARIRAQPEVVKRVLRNYKIVDAREFVPAEFNETSFVEGLVSSDFLYNRILHTNVANYVPIANQGSSYPGTAELPVTPSELFSEFNELMERQKTLLEELLTVDTGKDPQERNENYFKDAVTSITEWVFNDWAGRFVGGGDPYADNRLDSPDYFNQGESDAFDGVKIISIADAGETISAFEKLTAMHSLDHAKIFGYTPTSYGWNSRNSPTGEMFYTTSRVSEDDDGTYNWDHNRYYEDDLYGRSNNHEQFIAMNKLSQINKQIRVYVPRRRFPDGGSSTNPETAPDTEYNGDAVSIMLDVSVGRSVDIPYSAGQNIKESALDYVGHLTPIVNLGLVYDYFTTGDYYRHDRRATVDESPMNGFMIARLKESLIHTQVETLVRELFGLNEELETFADSDHSTNPNTTFDSYIGQMPAVIAKNTLNEVMTLVNALPAGDLNSESEREIAANVLVTQMYSKIDEQLSDYLNNNLCRIMLGTAAIDDTYSLDGGLKEGKSIVSIKYFRPGANEVPMVFGSWAIPGYAALTGTSKYNNDRFIYEFGGDIQETIRSSLVDKRAQIKVVVMQILKLQGYFAGTAADVGIHSALAETDIVLKKYGYFFFDMEKFVRKQSTASQVMNVDRFLSALPSAKQMTNNAVIFSQAKYINHNFGSNGVKLTLISDQSGDVAKSQTTEFETLEFMTTVETIGRPWVYSKVNTLSNITFDQITEYTSDILIQSPSDGAPLPGGTGSGFPGASPAGTSESDLPGYDIVIPITTGEGSSTAPAYTSTTDSTGRSTRGEVDIVGLLGDPLYQPADQHSLLVLRNYAFPGFNNNSLYAGKTWRNDYRLMCFYYQIFMDDDNAFINPFFKGPPYSNDAVTLSIELHDNSHTMVQALSDHYQGVLDTFKDEYFDVAIEGCAYDNYNHKFNDFFTEQMLLRFPDPTTSPWFRMVAIYTLYMNIFTDAYSGDKAKMEQAANIIIESVRPETGTLSYLLEFYEQLSAFKIQLETAATTALELHEEGAGNGYQKYELNTIVSEMVIDHIGDYSKRADVMNRFNRD